VNRSLYALLYVLALPACSHSTAPQPSDVVLIPTKSLYTSGETVSAQLFNRSEEQIGYGACSLRLEHLAGSQWVLIGPEQVPCDLILYVLDPASTRIMQLPLDKALESGRYRLRQEILPQTNLPARKVHSPEFRLQNAA
jgi:hypothetical protein